MRRQTPLALLAVLTVALLAACDRGAEATPTPVPTLAATPTATPTPDPTPTPEPTPSEPVASTAATPTAELPVIQFVRRDGSVVELPVEVPPREEYGVGLSGRRELEGRGMLFYYPGGQSNVGFWMKNTHIPLDIAFVDLRGRIIEIAQMEPESLEVTRPERPYEMAIEAPAGWFEEHEVRPGDLARPAFPIPEHLLEQ